MSQLTAVSQERCEDELIRIPGSIQPHGFFLLTDAALSTVRLASENAADYLGLPLKLILGTALETLFDRELISSLRLLQVQPESERDGLVTYLGSFRVGAEQFSVVTHCAGSQRALEFERQDRLVGAEMMNSVITNFVGTLSRLESEGDLLSALSQQIADLTGFDRVLIYSFNQDGHGTVLAERNNRRLPSYLGLRFPATDIPQQARELYLLNTVRIIPDANYTPSALVGLPDTEPTSVDLSLSVLRSVSPVHLEYMRNMGTASSMSVSLVIEGRLWGLISGHHAEPRVVPYLVRSACDMLSKMASTQLTAFHTADRLHQVVRFHSVQRRILTSLAAEPNYIDALAKELDGVMQVTNAMGVALLVDDHVYRLGMLPGNAEIERLGQWLDGHADLDVFVTASLGEDLPWAESIREVASGALAVRISPLLRRYLIWFRPELVKTVHWAGEPAKITDKEGNLHPRHSFSDWRQTVLGRSDRWSEVEIESAQDFRSALASISLRRAEEAVELGEARFERLTQALPVKIFTTNDDGRLTYVNERWRSAGLSTAGRWYDEALLKEEDRQLCGDRWRQCVQEGKPFEAEVRLISPQDGSERWNVARIIPFHRAGAARAGWIGTFIDLTESKERETALRMSEKLALTGRMTSVIAHEINNPLEAITNLMYLLRSEMPDAGPASSYIAMVESELERISGITKQTLRWNRETSDQPQNFSAGSLVDDVLRLFAGKIRNRQIVIRTEGERALGLRGVLGQVRQVLANLVSNAIDAAPVGGSVTVRILRGDDQHGFAVADNGEGMAEGTQKRLFEPFYSTKGDLGNGLGLYISREIVERHGGTILVDSGPDRGTVMTVLLPA